MKQWQGAAMVARYSIHDFRYDMGQRLAGFFCLRRLLGLAGLCLILGAVVGCSLVTGGGPEQAVENCNDLECYQKHAARGVTALDADINFWANVNLVAQITVTLLGVVTAVMLGWQDDSSKHWTRPIGLIATTLATSIGGGLSSFHVHDNIDKLIGVQSDLIALTNKLELDVTNAKDDKEKQKYFYTYAGQYTMKTMERAKVRGSAGRLYTKSEKSTAE